MRSASSILLKLVCLGLVLLVGWQVRAIASRGAGSSGIEPEFAGDEPSVVKPPDASSPSGKADAAAVALPEFPERYGKVAEGGMFGKAPPKKIPPPALLGFLGQYAIIRSPKGREDLVKEGGEIDGVKVLRIATNRVLIEYQEKTQELTIYAGVGSSSLLTPQEGKKP